MREAEDMGRIEERLCALQPRPFSDTGRARLQARLVMLERRRRMRTIAWWTAGLAAAACLALLLRVRMQTGGEVLAPADDGAPALLAQQSVSVPVQPARPSPVVAAAVPDPAVSVVSVMIEDDDGRVWVDDRGPWRATRYQVVDHMVVQDPQRQCTYEFTRPRDAMVIKAMETY